MKVVSLLLKKYFRVLFVPEPTESDWQPSRKSRRNKSADGQNPVLGISTYDVHPPQGRRTDETTAYRTGLTKKGRLLQ